MELKSIPLSKIVDAPYQPRQNLEIEALESLASSIKELGLLQPIVVRPQSDGDYQLIAGSRRYAATKILGWTDIPAHISNMSDVDASMATLSENVTRQDLNPVDVALMIKHMLTELGMSRIEIANTFGHDVAWISQQLSLLDLPEYLYEAVQTDTLSKSVAIELGRIQDEDMRQMYVAYAIKGGCTLKVAREWVRQATATAAARDRRVEMRDQGEFEPIEPLPAPELPHCWICHAPGDKVNLETIPLCWHCQQAIKES